MSSFLLLLLSAVAFVSAEESGPERMPWVVGQDVHTASRALRRLGVELKFEQVLQEEEVAVEQGTGKQHPETDTIGTSEAVQAAEFTVAYQKPDSGAALVSGQTVTLGFLTRSRLLYFDDFVVPLLADVKRIVPYFRATNPPRPVVMPAADYPLDLLKFTFSGRAEVEALVDFDGAVLAARVIKPSGYEQADSSALAAAMKASFSGAEHHDQPMRVWVPIPYTFQYKDIEGLPKPPEGTREGD